MQLVRLVIPHKREDNDLPILFGMGDEFLQHSRQKL
jgi:hypothetical protein